MEQQSVGTKIRALRERKAWTQEHLAQAAGLAARTVQRAEDGTLSAESLSAIAGALDVPVERFAAPKAPPKDWPRMSAAIFYDDAGAAIDFLERAFGFTTRLKVPGPDGKIMHSELELYDALIMVATAGWDPMLKSPQALGGVTMGLHIFVDDVDEHCATAKKAGAKILLAPETSHGQRRYKALDLEGHMWSFAEQAQD